jgi:hypothetical protein
MNNNEASRKSVATCMCNENDLWDQGNEISESQFSPQRHE